jgi:hypothetical protein
VTDSAPIEIGVAREAPLAQLFVDSWRSDGVPTGVFRPPIS